MRRGRLWTIDDGESGLWNGDGKFWKKGERNGKKPRRAKDAEFMAFVSRARRRNLAHALRTHSEGLWK